MAIDAAFIMLIGKTIRGYEWDSCKDAKLKPKNTKLHITILTQNIIALYLFVDCFNSWTQNVITLYHCVR